MSRIQTSKAKLESLGEGRFRVSGILDASTVSGVLDESARKFAGISSITVDLSHVTESDSAGLALLLEWLRVTRRAGAKIFLHEVPQQIMALARISEVDDLLLENGSGVVPAPVAGAAAQSA